MVIPARDAAATIDAQLEALLAEEWDRPWEIVVVDNGSRDATNAIVDRYAARDAAGAPRRRVRPSRACRTPATSVSPRRAPSRSRCATRTTWSRRAGCAAMGDALREHEFVTGPLDVDRLNPAWVAESRGRAIETGPGDFRGVFPFAHSCNLGVRKAVVTACGGFDERLDTGEDIELSFRLWRAGVALTYVPDARRALPLPHDVGELWDQSRAHARVAPWLEQRVRDAGVALPADREWRRWLWLVRHCGLLASRPGRARWVSVAGGRVGRLEGRWRDAARDGGVRWT